VATLAEVVSAGVDNNGAAENTLGADQLDELVTDRALGVALAVGLEVAQVTNVALLVLGGTVGLAVRVEVRAGGSAAVGVVTEGVNVHTTLSVGIVASDVP